MTSDEAKEILKRAAAALGEHFDSVQILASDHNGEGTRAHYQGVGNWYARQGLAHEFISMDAAEELSDQIAKKLDPPDDSDAWKAT